MTRVGENRNATDEALRARLAAGDAQAFDELYRRHVHHLCAFARRMLGDAQEAEDVCHDAFMAMLRETREPIENQRAWLFTVTRNLCLNRLRARRRAGAALDQPTATRSPTTPEDALASDRRSAALSRAVGRLPARLADLYRLRSEGLSYREVSSQLGIPIGTVKSRIHELTRLLQEELDAPHR